MDAGGYTRAELWEPEFRIEGRPISRAHAMARFVDRTGRAGPATWEGGRFPPGQEDLPVSGVSWYEASAYARWVGKSLPTVFHWHRAAMTVMGAHFIPGSNMESNGPMSVKSRLGMSPFGLFNMAGNVREWCANATGTQRFILGGGWPDHPYMLMDAFAQDPFDRKVANGIRLVRYPRDEANLALAMRPLERKGRDFSKEVPVSDVEFLSIRRLYDYDRTPLNPTTEPRDSTEDWVREKVTIDAAYGGERLPVYVYLPRNARKPYQSVMFFPGSGAFVIQNGLANLTAAEHVIRSGRALIYPIYKSTHERQDTWVDGTSHQSVRYRDEMAMWVKDFRRSVDYLVTRSDMDTARVAYFGVSWGGHMGGILPALEPRLKAAMLYVVGFPVERGRPEVELLNFLPRVTIPVLMLNGRFDPYFPVESSQKPFFQHLGTPAHDKRHFIAEGGHFVPREQMVAESLDWLDKYLGRPMR